MNSNERKTKKSTAQQGLPAHWKRSRVLAALCIFVIVVVATFPMRHLGAADRLDSWWLRARFSAREKMQPVQPDPDIVLVDIDDRTSARWREPIVFWGPHFADAIDNLTRSGARLIALDYIQAIPLRDMVKGNGKDTEAARAAFDTYDQRFGEALSRAPGIVMVKELITTDNKSDWLRPTSELLYSLPDAFGNEEKFLGYANTGSSESVVAAMPPVQINGGKIEETSFAARIAERALKTEAKLENGQWVLPGKAGTPLRENKTVFINYANGSGRGGSGRRNSDGGGSSGGRDNTMDDAASPFRHFSLYDVAQPMTRPNPAFKDKIVLIGATFTGSNDDHFVPFLQGLSGTRQIPGVEMQANFVRTLLSGNALREPNALQRWMLAIVLGLAGLAAFFYCGWAAAALTTLAVAVGWIALSCGLFATQSYALPINLPLFGLLLGGGSMGAFRALGEERVRQQVLNLWGRYQDPRLVNYLLQHPNARGGQGQEMEVTVLFADLKNFTKTVEHLSPTEAIQMLNRYLALMTEIVLKYDGYVDKYLGDGLMAQWGAPEPWATSTPQRNHALAALRACQELDQRTRELTEEITGGQTGEKPVTFGLRLTLHSGPVIVGWVGADRIEFTIIGDTVNVCSRLQETAKQLSCEFLISESTYEKLGEQVATGQQTEVEIRGRKQPLRVYEITETAKS